jgi:AbrB family transcriptional regulator (stage V sporulation protein T)
MRATGIIRRIDDLGRVVIPREIRRAMRIKEGDPLEIFLENDCVCFKRYNMFDENMINNTKKLLKNFSIMCSFNIVVTDTDKIIASTETLKNINIDQLSTVGFIEKVRDYGILEKGTESCYLDEENKIEVLYSMKIIHDGDFIGTVSIVQREDDKSNKRVEAKNIVQLKYLEKTISELLN